MKGGKVAKTSRRTKRQAFYGDALYTAVIFNYYDVLCCCDYYDVLFQSDRF